MSRSKQGAIVRRGKRIYARIRWTETDSGRPVRREKYARVRTISEGRERIRQMLHELEDAGPAGFDAEQMRFADLAAHYAAEVLQPAEYAGDRKISGLRNLASPRAQLSACLEYFGPRLIRSIGYADLQAFKRARAQRITRRGGRPSIVTVHRELERLHAVFEFARRRQWIQRNPFDGGPPLINKADEPIRETIPTADEVRAILAQCRGPRAHLRGILLCIRDTGMRPAEMFRLQVGSVDLAAGTIEVLAQNSKTGRRRLVGISQELRAELEEIITAGELGPGDLLFGIRSNVRRAYATACRLAGVQGINLYAWRHLCATDMARAGIPDALAMKQLGHTEAKTWRRYVTVEASAARETAGALEEYRKKAKGER